MENTTNVTTEQKSVKAESTPKKKRFLDRYNEMPRALQKGKYLFIILGITIPVLHFLVFYVGVNFTSIVMAFQRTSFVDGVEKTSFTLENFKLVFDAFGDGGNDMFIALRNTVVLFFVDLFMMVPIFLIAYAFSKNLWWSNFYRVMLYLPSIISSVAFSTMITSILQENVGALAVMCREYFGWDLPNIFQSYDNAFKGVLGYCMWAGLYTNLLLLEGAVRRIPRETLDAAHIDGVNRAQEIFYIILPMIWGTLSTLLIIKFSGFFTITGPILTLTNGAYNTQTLNFWFYKMTAVTGGNDMNKAAAGGLVFTLVGLPIVYGFRWIVNKISDNVEY